MHLDVPLRDVDKVGVGGRDSSVSVHAILDDNGTSTVPSVGPGETEAVAFAVAF